jgi:hypothetical protein
MQIINALQAKAGVRTKHNTLGVLTQPVQFIPMKDKDEEWSAWNIDWIEDQGIKQIRRNSKRFLKNIRLAHGIIDRTDYIIDEGNETSDLLELLTKEDQTAFDLKFFPVIPNVIKVLSGEFSKRVSKLSFRAVDDLSYNEMVEEKRQMVEDSLLRKAEMKMLEKMIEMGLDPESEEAQQMMSPENIKSLPEIEDFFRKDYRSIVEEWATHQRRVDEERFKMSEMEERQFRRMLTLDREFWHFKMNEDDYELEEWDPVFTFFHKSPAERYVSNGNFAGKVDLITVSDVIDKYGYLMSEPQLRSLESMHPIKQVGYSVLGTARDDMYDGTKSWDWNQNMPSLGMRQLNAVQDYRYPQDIMSWLQSENDDALDFGSTNLLRVTTVYWKTQRKVGHLIRITEDGEQVQDIVDETYRVTDKPLYDTSFFKDKTKDNLIFGEHIDWIWINEVWGGVKIGQNHRTSWDDSSQSTPIYLGINKSKPGRLPFQFKGDLTLYGCKLPVEGFVGEDPNVRSVSLVDLMKPFQIGYNLVNNQISDILVDELGTVILLDQNAIPKNSLGEDWGRNNLAKAFVAMKNFQILPLDTTLAGTEGALQFNQYTQLNMEQTQRLMSRIELARYFKDSAFEVVGVTPQRLGQTTTSESATGVQQAVQNSYAQTEPYFIKHSDYLMPRVHQMRTDLAQFYQATKPSIRLQYSSSMDERENFKIHGTKLLSRDFNVFATTKVNHREILNQMKQLAITNNTAGASIHDLGNVLKSESISELARVTKAAEDKIAQQRQAEYDHQKELEDARLAAEAAEKKAARDFEAVENDKDRKKDVLVSQINSARFADTADDGSDDYLNRLNIIQGQQEYQDTMSFKREQESNKVQIARENTQLQRDKMNSDNTRADKELMEKRIMAASKPKPAAKKK